MKMEFKTEESCRRTRRARTMKRGGIAPLPVMVEEVVVPPPNVGAASRGRKRRGGRANLRGRHKQPGPHSTDDLVICEITVIPDGQSNETIIYPKRMRQASDLATAPPPPPSPPTASTSTSQQHDVEVVDEDAAVSSDAEIAPPLSPWFVECGVEDSAPSTTAASPSQHPPRCPRQSVINFGSEAGSDESEDEELASLFIIPRAQWSALDTPLDPEDYAFDQGKDEPDLLHTVDSASEPAEYATASTSSSIPDAPPTATDQPWRLYDFDWKPFPDVPIPPESRREKFSHNNVGPTTPRVDPYDIFVDIWDRQFMEYIASETNKYAQQVAAQMLNNHTLAPKSRISRWRDTTADEMYIYFGIVIAMGIVVKSRMEDYWSATPDVFYTPGFSAHMSGYRFALLNKCLHFANNEDMRALDLDGSEAKLFKVQPVLSHLNKKFQSMYRLSQNIALDESLLQWKGSLDINQLIPNKVAPVGIKTYELCESQTGYLWRFEVHAQKGFPQQLEDPLNASTPAVVLRLTHNLEGKGHTLWMDNFYNSPCLARHLKSLGFDCVGTLRTNRKCVPQALHSLTKQNMRPGQITGLTSGDVDVMVWRDNNRVAMLSTYHGNSQQTHRGSTKPILIHDYNIMMGGVDKKDQLLAMYPIERKRTKVWYKKLFRRLLNVSILNAHIIHRQSFPSPSLAPSHRAFRIDIVKSLLSKHCSQTFNPATTQVLRQTKPFDVSHRVAEYPFGNTQVKHQRRRRKCVQCGRLAQTFCVGCSKTVCIEPCFLALHS